MVHLHNGILHSYKKEVILTLCNSMDGPGDYYAEYSKPVRERQIPYDLAYTWNLMNKINWQQNKTRGMDTRNRLTAVREEGVGDWKRLSKEYIWVYAQPRDPDNNAVKASGGGGAG